SVQRSGRVPPQGNAARGRGPGVDQHAPGGRADRALWVRARPNARAPPQGHARAQDQRADVRRRSLPAGGGRGSARVPGRRNRLRARRRRVHLLPRPALAVRRDRHRQHVRRHHHGPRGDDPGRDGDRRRRQHQSGGRLDVRADRRHRARSHGQGDDQPACRDRGGGDAARPARGARRGRPGGCRHPVRLLQAALHAGGRDGLHDLRGRRPRRRGGDRLVSGSPSPSGLRVELYDTTLRDGAQRAGLSYSIEDRLRILHKLDSVGFPFIEGGWPGANPRETEFFRLATKERLTQAILTAFGMTRKAGERADTSQVLRDLLEAGTEVVCVVGKAWDLHVTEALRTDLDEGLAMVRDSIAFLRREGRRVFFDAEHFFDGYRRNSTFSMAVLAAAEEAGAERLVLCDTNGGTLPAEIARVVREVAERTSVRLGIHVHNDAGCAVANSLAAVEAGAFQVQGTVNGYGERTGNADLVPVAANLALKMGVRALPPESLERLTELAHYVAEIANVTPDSHQPYVGR